MAYSKDIPEPTDRIKASQNDMLQNFQSIHTVVGIDHVNFDDASGTEGKHKFVTLQRQAADRATNNPATEIALYSKNVVASNQSELHFRRQNNGVVIPFTQADLSLNRKGWTFLPSGAMMVWGENAITVAGTTIIYATGLTGFPGFVKVPGLQISSETSHRAIFISALGAVNFSARTDVNSTITWFAIGS